MATFYVPSESGVGESHGYFQYIRFKVDQTYDAGANRSTLSITLQYKGPEGDHIISNPNAYARVDGSAQFTPLNGNLFQVLSVNTWTDLKTSGYGPISPATLTVTHAADGSASIGFSLYIGMGNLTWQDSSTLTLNNTPQTNPVVGAPNASVVDLTGNFPNKYIAGYTKVKVAAAVTAGAGATISSVKLSYPGGTTVNMTYNSGTQKYEGTTAASITGNTTFTVTATDSNGRTGTNAISLTSCVPYTPPSITIDAANTWRCNSSGTKTSGGTYYRAKATANYYAALSGNRVTTFNVKIKGSGSATNLTSGTQSGAISGLSNPLSKYTIVFTIKDKVSAAVTREYVLEGMLRNIVVKRSSDGTYVGVGTTPTRSSGASCIELPSGGDYLAGDSKAVFKTAFSIPAGGTATITFESSEYSFLIAANGYNATIMAGLWYFGGYATASRGVLTAIANSTTAITITTSADAANFTVANSSANAAIISILALTGRITGVSVT